LRHTVKAYHEGKGKASENKYLFAIAIRHTLLYDFHMPDKTQTATAKPTVKLLDEDGNALLIIGRCRKAATKAGWTPERWRAVQSEMMDGDYDHVLQVVMAHFDVA